jgi:hypothetical protein
VQQFKLSNDPKFIDKLRAQRGAHRVDDRRWDHAAQAKALLDELQN